MSVTTFSPAPLDLDVRPAERTAGALATASAVGLRTVRKFTRTPQQLVLSVVTGAMFLLIFRYVFGGAIDAGPVPYVDFLVPGYIVTSVLFTGGDVSVGFAEDLDKGVTDRFRSLPVSRTALLTGRIVAESALLVMGLAITTAIGFLVGFRIHGSIGQALGAFALCAVFGFTFMWLFALLGLGDSSLAGVGQHSTAYWVGLSLVWCAGLVAVFAPLAVRRYRRS